MADLEPRTRLGRVVEGVVIGLATMAVVALAVWVWQSYSHGIFVKWLGGMARPDIEREIKEVIEAREDGLKVLTGRVLITTGSNDTFERLQKEGNVFGVVEIRQELTSGEKKNRGVMRGRVDFPEPFASAPKVIIALSTIDTGMNTNTRIRTTVDQVDTEGFHYRFHVWHDSVLYRAEASWMAVGR